MILSIITINRNNSVGLEKTLKSVGSQKCKEFEHVIVDGASTDGGVDVIREYADSLGNRVKWVSEPDKGIYNAMNKGIKMASGDYIQILNSGDSLVSDDVIKRMLAALKDTDFPSSLYGNMLKDMPLDTLKVDMAFIRELEKSDRVAVILKFIVELAKALGMDVVIEGVETQAQVDYVKSLGDVAIQGYFFSRPLPIPDYENLLDKYLSNVEVD